MANCTIQFLVSREEAAAAIGDDMMMMCERMRSRKGCGGPTWHHAIQAHTFRTVIGSFLSAEAIVITRLSTREELPDDDRKTISELSSKRTNLLAHFPNGTLFKFDLRSPKDVRPRRPTPGNATLSGPFEDEFGNLRNHWTSNDVAAV
jgi:hypothetical protein